MFSRLDPVFKPTFRHAEETDARLAIRQDDHREDPRKKQKGREDKTENEFGDDQAVISVTALKTFLETMIGTRPVDGGGVSPAPVPDADPQTHAAAHAAHAYQSVAAGTSGNSPATDGPQPMPDLSRHERDTIADLIKTLETLQGHDILELRVGRPSSSLLEGLLEAANRARGSL